MAWSNVTWLIFTISVFRCTSGFLAKDPASVLETFVRASGSTDSAVSTVSYLNGSVFGKQPGNGLQKLFNFEGYNINRKIKQTDGSYLSLSREIVVYRNPVTAQIVQAWMNPWTSNANEIFFVANDPVNGLLSVGDIPPPLPVLKGRILFNLDILLEYPNPLASGNYSKYSAGPTYDAVELFGYFANGTLLNTSRAKSVPMTATWIRKSQYLPWMEMSTTPGGLYYTTMSWKCNEGLSCVAKDIMDLVNKYFFKYKTAPTKEVDPNETSWTVFKKTIDQRREAGLPDILIPQMNVTTNTTTKVNAIDDRVVAILEVFPISLRLTGNAWSEITGKQPIHLFDITGFVGLDFEPLPRGDGYRIQLDGFVTYLDPVTKRRLQNWTNPITGGNVAVPKENKVGVDLIFKKDFMYTMDIPTSKVVGLLAAQSTEGDGDNGDWSVNIADLIFEYEELDKPPEKASFYGSAAMFSNWLSWMDMADVHGNLVVKTTVQKGI